MGHASETIVKENGTVNVNWELGQKNRFLLDQRDKPFAA